MEHACHGPVGDDPTKARVTLWPIFLEIVESHIVYRDHDPGWFDISFLHDAVIHCTQRDNEI
jgi:hypothetical protein